jgi:hypothetical protein
VTLSPISAVSPMTTPVPWSMNSACPMVAAGWISTFVIARVASAIQRGTSGTRAASSMCATR